MRPRTANLDAQYGASLRTPDKKACHLVFRRCKEWFYHAFPIRMMHLKVSHWLTSITWTVDLELRTDNSSTIPLLDHLFRSMLIAEHNSSPVNLHDIVPVLHAR